MANVEYSAYMKAFYPKGQVERIAALRAIDDFLFGEFQQPRWRRVPWHRKLWMHTVGRVVFAVRSWIHRDCGGY